MPSLPRIWRPPQLGPRKPAETRVRVARADKPERVARGTTAERGYGARWQRSSLAWRRLNPLCVSCKANGVIRASTLVDHIVPHKGDDMLLWDQENWQALCDHCHSVHKRLLEYLYRDGEVTVELLRLDRPVPNYRRDASQSRVTEWQPAGLRPSAIPLTMVCGAPASGKSTWVREHASPGDVVIDLDDIGAELSGEGNRLWDRVWLRRAIARRNDMLRALAHASAGKAFFIIGCPVADDREWWARALHPGAVVVMLTNERTCFARCKADPLRSQRWSELSEVIHRWWTYYTPRAGDTVIT